MKSDNENRPSDAEENRGENIRAGHEVESEAVEVHEPQPNGWVAQLRQIVQGSPQGASSNIKRQQLKEDRTKSFLLLAGLTVVLALAFFAMFSTPNSRKNIARADHPNLGRARDAENPDRSHSVTPLLSADTRRLDDNTGSVSPDDIRNTAKQRMLAQASPSFGTPPGPAPEAPRPEPKDYALNRIQFSAETPEQTPPPPAPSSEKPTKASLVFVSVASGTRGSALPGSNVQPAVAERDWEFMVLPAGTRLVARLETPVSSAVKTPVVAAIEYNYERNGEIVIPAGSRAFGELSQVNEQGYVGIQFHSIQLPDETAQKIEGHAVGLQYQPLRGDVTGRNTGKRFLVRSLAGVGTILAATVGVQTGTGVTDSFSNNVLLREQVANNLANAGQQQLNEQAYRQNIVVTVPGNTRFYIVLTKPANSASAGAGSFPVLGGNPTPGNPAASTPSVQELRELLELRQELTQMYQQQQKSQIAQNPPDQQ
jgi:hypothetical protein